MSAENPTHPQPARLTRALLFTLGTVPLGALALVVLLTGWAITLCLSITPLLIAGLNGFAWTLRAVATLEAAVARRLLDAPVGPALPPPKATGFWRQGTGVLTDTQFWRQHLYLVSRFTVGWFLSIVELSLLGGSIWFIGSPIFYRWIPQGDGDWHGINLGIWRADSLPKTLPLVAIGLVALPLSVRLLSPLARWWRRIAVALLPATTDAIQPASASHTSRPTLRKCFDVHAAVVATIGVVLVFIWMATTHGYFWPAWPLLLLITTVAINGWVTLVLDRRGRSSGRPFTTALAIHSGIATIIQLFLVGLWALASRGYFWPAWTLLGLGVTVVIHCLVALANRVETLQQLRRGAVHQHETDRQRIERDLHDGTQARLVALGMNLGLAEQKFDTDPNAARTLVNEARLSVGETLRELRDLVRGIRPPVLADRGLGAAIAALADRTPLPVTITTDIDPRPTDPVETAAYFVVAEALTNAAKHAGATQADVRLQRVGPILFIDITDDGNGGADGTGNGLTGLRQRVEALDGRLTISSPSGGPTVLHAELPCAP